MTILFNFASRSRPDRFFETLDNIIRNCYSLDFFIVCKLDEDDTEMNNPTIRERIAGYQPKIIVKWGASASKIDAINRGLNDGDLPPWHILVNCSDDMRFKTQGFDNIIRKHMPDNLDAFLHFPDDYAKDRVSTCSIVGWSYYQRDMHVYWHGYYSMWSDDEETYKAKARGCYIYVPNAMEIEHLHYTNDRKAVKDKLYWRNDTYNADMAIFEQRKARGFDL
jgi:hypothetical protein